VRGDVHSFDTETGRKNDGADVVEGDHGQSFLLEIVCAKLEGGWDCIGEDGSLLCRAEEK
jgi:N6-adenosine-specific RNA methylase IME4